MKTPVQFNFRKYWSKLVKPHLRKKEVQELVNAGMASLVDQLNEELAASEEHSRIGWNVGDCPAMLGRRSHAPTVPPKRDSLEWYQPIGGCHWIAPFVLGLAKCIFPNDEWFIVEGKYHSIVTNEQRSLVFDILLFDVYTARQSLVYAGEKPLNRLERSFFDSIETGHALEVACGLLLEEDTFDPDVFVKLNSLVRDFGIKRFELERKFNPLGGGK